MTWAMSSSEFCHIQSNSESLVWCSHIKLIPAGRHTSLPVQSTFCDLRFQGQMHSQLTVWAERRNVTIFYSFIFMHESWRLWQYSVFFCHMHIGPWYFNVYFMPVPQLYAVLPVRTEVSVWGTMCAPVLRVIQEKCVKRVSENKDCWQFNMCHGKVWLYN